MTAEIKQARHKLASLTPELWPIGRAASSALEDGFRQVENGPLYVGPQPGIGPGAFLYTIFPPCNAFLLDGPLHVGMPLPKAYRSVLLSMNGCDAKGLSLFGHPQGSGPSGSPLSLLTANDPSGGWIAEWGKFSAPHLFIGVCNVDEDDQVGYFMDLDGKVEARLLSAKKQVATYERLSNMLETEVEKGATGVLVKKVERALSPMPNVPTDLGASRPLRKY